ncbi:MAG: SH3 domain-containing protein [Candidatus Aminicenantales bacterium]
MLSFKKQSYLLCLSLFFLTINPWLAAQTTAFKIKVSEEFANIRSRPDIRSPILIQVPQNTILNAVKKEAEWFLVTWKDEEGTDRAGYVHESLVVVIESPQAERPKKEPELAAKEEGTQEKAKLPETKKSSSQKGAEKQPPAVKEKAVAGLLKKNPFCLKLAPGAEFFLLTQVNDAAAGLAGFMADISGEKKQPPVTSFHWAPAVSLEMGLPGQSGFSCLLNLSHFSGQQENLVSFSGAAQDSSLLIRSRLRALPLSLLINYEFLPFLAIALGPEITSLEYGYIYRLIQKNSLEEWSGRARTLAFGVRARLTFTAWLGKTLGFYFEAGGRLEEANGLKGKDTHLAPSGETFEEEGKLYFFLVKTYGDRSYPALFIRSKRPSEAGVELAREASLNLGGGLLRLGLVFRF